MRISAALIISIGLLLAPSLPAATIHVPGDQPTIQAGIDAAVDGDTVLVADGTWTGAGNTYLDFVGRAITLRSENGPDTCIIDCQGDGRGFNFTAGEGPDTVVDGFTVCNGMADYAGAILCESASPTLTRLIITACDNDDSSAIIDCINSSIIISHSQIVANMETAVHCSYDGAGSPQFISNVISDNMGTGILARSNGHTLIVDNIIENNDSYGVMGSGPITITGNLVSGNGAGLDINGSDVLIEGNTITGNGRASGAGIQCACNGLITGNVIRDNEGYSRGGGIYIEAGAIDVIDNTISDNSCTGGSNASMGGGIYCSGTQYSGTVSNNRITGNHADQGGGICVYNNGSTATVSNNLIAGNTANTGAGICCDARAHPILRENTVVNNAAGHRGGGLSCIVQANVTVTNSIFWGNTATLGRQLDLGSTQYPSTLTISWSDVQGGQDQVFTAPNCTLNWGEGMIADDPLFVSGPLGGYYLSQTAAGQIEDSPCVDRASPPAGPLEGTTRTDHQPDIAPNDMGYHYSGQGPVVIVGLGPGPSNPPRIRVFPPEQDAGRIGAFPAYNSTQFGVTISCGDVDGDGLVELLTGPGPGPQYGPNVRGFELDGTPIPGLSFQAYGTHKFGVNVAAGNLDGIGPEEIISGAGPGAVFGPHVRAFSYSTTGTVSAVPGVSFLAYGTPKWGVNVTAGDFDGDGFDEIVTGAGPGAVYGAHVRGWNVDGGAATAIPGISYFAYDTPRFGVKVAGGDIDGDGMAEIITAPGPSPAFGAHIRGWDYDGSAVTPMSDLSFFAWPAEEARHGATIFAGVDMDEDGRNELVVGAGPDPGLDSLVNVYRLSDGTVSLWFSLQAFPDGWSHGATVAAGRF